MSERNIDSYSEREQVIELKKQELALRERELAAQESKTKRGAFLAWMFAIIMLGIVLIGGFFFMMQLTGMSSTIADLQAQLVGSRSEQGGGTVIIAETPDTAAAAPSQATATPYPTYTPDVTPTPLGRVSGGSPIVVDNISVYMDSSSINVHDNNIRLAIVVKNTGTQRRVFRYTPNSIIVKDDLGNVYDHHLGYDCNIQHLSLVKQIAIDPGKEVEITSHLWWWRLEDEPGHIPEYAGPISLQARSLIIVFEDFGPFSGVEIEVDL
jgi:hypothetical protein